MNHRAAGLFRWLSVLQGVEMPAAERLFRSPFRLAGLTLLLACIAPPVRADEAAWEALRHNGIALFRHATAPGTGDPAGFRPGDCATQRNLDEAGRTQARRIGATFRAQGIAVGTVLSSQWCRALETARLAFGDQIQAESRFDSFFGERSEGPARTAAARAFLLGWQGPGALVVTTHQVNITGLTGIVPASGEAVVLQVRDGKLEVVGRLRL